MKGFEQGMDTSEILKFKNLLPFLGFQSIYLFFVRFDVYFPSNNKSCN